MYAVAAAEDDSILLAGYTADTFDGANTGGLDFAAVKLDRDGNEMWRWQVRQSSGPRKNARLSPLLHVSRVQSLFVTVGKSVLLAVVSAYAKSRRHG